MAAGPPPSRPAGSDSVGIRTIGIVGAGKVGTVLARLALAAGYRVLISASGHPDRIGLIVDVLAHGAEPLTTREVVEGADAVILALPLHKLSSLPLDAFAGKLTIDATNYWQPTDGDLPEFVHRTVSSSEIVQRELPGARLVKGFSHLGYHQLDEGTRPPGAADRIALALAGDDPDAVAATAQIVDRLGFDPLVTGPLATGRRFEAGTSVFGVELSRAELESHVRPDTIGSWPPPRPS